MSKPTSFRPLRGLRVLSLGLNLPAPVALQRCRELGARVAKLEPPQGDPVAWIAPALYRELHQGVRVQQLDLKTAAGARRLEQALDRCDVLLTSFRPSALRRLGLGWRSLHPRWPQLWQVAIVGASGAGAEDAGHDLTYQTEQGLLPAGTTLPTTLLADMGGAQAAVAAVLQAALGRAQGLPARRLEVGLADAANDLARPLRWGLTHPGGLLGGGHALYRVLPCRDGRVALAALEPHFAARVAALAGIQAGSATFWLKPAAHQAVSAWVAAHSCAELATLAREHDLPLVVCPDAPGAPCGDARAP